MKKFKLLIPMMVFVMGIGMAFTPKSNGVSAGWINLNGVPYQLKFDPCTSNQDILCRVVFINDPNAVEYQVYEDQDFNTPKIGGTISPYLIME